MSVNFHTDNNVGYVVFDDPDARVNVLNSTVLEKLGTILQDVAQRSDLKAVVFLSRKANVFIAGADIREIESIDDITEGQQKAASGQAIMNQIEDLPMPTVAVIDGVALGGGCELAIACRYRIATFNDCVRLGQPEVKLGFIPGFGGTWRLPRIIGLSESLNMILTGKTLNAEKALLVGLVDRLIPLVDLEKSIYSFLEDVGLGRINHRRYAGSRKKGIAGLLDRFLPGHALIFWQSRRMVLRQTKGFYPAPLEALAVIQKNYYMKRDKGLALEAQAFGQLAVTDMSKNLVHLFYLSEKYRKLSVPGGLDVPRLPLRRFGIVGAGVMGGAIAQALVSKEKTVRLKDLTYDALALAYRSASRIFDSAKRQRRIFASGVRTQMSRLTHTLDYKGFDDLDMVIEAVVEDMGVKTKVFRDLADAVDDRTILASNTSALSITEMAQACPYPEKVIGVHFFNPVHKMPLVEVITTPQTSAQTVMTVLGLVKELGKTAILVKDSPGFVVNRILLAYMSEAGRLLEENGRMADIDRLVTGFGLPMGPFLLSDEVGLDVGLKVLRILQEAFGERFEVPRCFQAVYDAGLYGKKTGTGFYVHSGKSKRPNVGIQQFLSTPKRPLYEFEALDRLLLVMVNEAARILESGIVDGPDVIDVGMIYGAGFPPFRGGLLKYADQRGIAEIVRRLDALSKKLSADRFEPCNYLRRLDREEKTFYSL